MRKTRFFILVIFICLPFLFSQEKTNQTLELTLKTCLLKALENNLDVSVEALGPEISAAALSQAKEVFLPQFALSYGNLNQTTPGTWGIEGTNIKMKANDYSFGLSQRVPTGADLSLSFTNSMTDTSRAFAIVNPSYYSVLNLRLAQPLLKGFGPKINRREIITAENNREISVCQLKASVLQTIYDVEEAYWNLAYAIESLKVIEYSLEQSKEMLRRYREAEKVGAKSGIEVLGSETEVANWEDQIITARLQVERNQDRLKKLLNLPTGASDSVQTIIPIDKPSIEKKELTFEEALAIALKERPEMEIAQKELDTSALDVSYYKNQLLPELNLEFRLWRPGQSGVRYFYLNDDPLTRVVVGKIIGNRMDSLKDVFRRNYNNWEVNFTLNIPLGNIISRASLARAKKEKDQNLIAQARQKATIQYEVLEVIKELETNEKRIDSSGRYRELMAKRLEAETQRYQLGLVGSEWLFEYQRRLAAAKTEEEKAVIDYKVSLAKLEKVLGTSLKTRNIKFREFEF